MQDKLKSLDGLRGIAALFVLMSHLSLQDLNFHRYLNFSGSGQYGVFLFFALSAFLLSRQKLTLSPNELFTYKTWLTYFCLRILRIFPLYIFILFFTVIQNKIVGISAYFTTITWKKFALHLLLQRGEGIYWTIPVEFKYYILLPIIIFISLKILKNKISLCFLFICSISWITIYISPPEVNRIKLYPYISIFLMGTFAAICFQWIEQHEKIIVKMRSIFELIALLSFLAVIVTIPAVWSFFTGNKISSSHFHKSYLFYGIIWSIFIVSHMFGIGYIKYILSLKFMLAIGKISFSIYLWHMPIILFIKNHLELNNLLKILIIILSVLSVSLISYLLIESPFLELGKISIKKYPPIVSRLPFLFSKLELPGK